MINSFPFDCQAHVYKTVIGRNARVAYFLLYNFVPRYPGTSGRIKDYG